MSLALDSAGNPALSYIEFFYDPGPPGRNWAGDLALARWTGTSWTNEIIDRQRQRVWYTSLELDASDHPVVSYYDEANRDLKYARWTGSSWLVETVDSVGDVGQYLELELDAADNPAIAYYDATNGDLKYARWTGAVWAIEVVDSMNATQASLELDASGNPAISYSNAGLKYAHWTGSAWSIEIVTTRTATDTSLELDSVGNPAISYHSSGGGSGLKYAHWTGSAWMIETVDTDALAGYHSSLALDASDNPHISYEIYALMTGGGVGVKFARKIGTAWAIETVAPTYRFGGSSLELDAAGNPAISYIKSVGFPREFSMVYAHWSGTAWDFSTVVDSNASHTSLKFDSSGSPVISYIGYCPTWLGGLGHVMISRKRGTLLYRGVVPDLTPGWKASALPLTEANDDPSLPFPVTTDLGGREIDGLSTVAPLVLYRVLLQATLDSGNRLRVVKSSTFPGAVELSY